MNKSWARAAAISCLLMWAVGASAQSFCPPGTIPMPAPAPPGVQGAFMCQCPDGRAMDITGCASGGVGQFQMPTPPPVGPSYVDTSLSDAVRTVWDWVSRSQIQLDPRATLFSQVSREPREPPPNPAAQQALNELLQQRLPPPRPTASPAGGRTPSFTGQPTQIRPPPGRATTSQPAVSQPTGSYAACVGSSTFGPPNPPYCEMGGYIYFRNGRVLKSR